MPAPPPESARSGAWAAAAEDDALLLIAEGVTQIAGFGVAAISVARDDGHMQVMAVAGSDDARQQLEGRRTPIDALMTELAKADDWGMLKFVPHERLDLGEGEWGWVPDVEPLAGDDAWHPMDLLVAPLHDQDGTLRGSLSIDLPADGRRPGPDQRRVLELYAEQAARAVLTALEREELAAQVRLADTARRIVRQASVQPSLEHILQTSRPALTEGFRAIGMWIQTFDEDGLGTGSVYSADGAVVELPLDLIEIAETAARLLWAEQQVTVVAAGRPLGVLTAEQGTRVVDFLHAIEVGSILFVPLGAGRECLGNLVLTRPLHAPDWTETESAAALDVGRDLGGAILNVRAYEREHRLVTELQALDTYKSQLIATVSHELKNPLTSVLGHLEILESVEGLPGPVRTSLNAMERGARRLGRVVDDLLLLAKVGDPDNPVVARPVDLRTIVDDVVELTAVEAERRHLTVTVEAGSEQVLASGDATELDRVVSNLVSNALKYTAEGGRITVSVARVGSEVELLCSDEGLGISAEDQKQLFTEFFRSSNPAAVAQPGTGLGLAIVSRIVQRHGGHIAVESELGKGSTFRVLLPAA
ncbi:sensor histidine kinase [Nocardioides lianchengensis]|uniref:Sensor-like histidine kinase SenX3 n=1 Tax=Nocardioides lianchengensis TaxID=1045774 RepID=A0A1G6XVG4_9ACTN|nr:HAMP domain-containing sensor histidine kinase [Nocardioides lianchengensis]NYG13457.1 signal transduction histidine kinase [Nocardioides lianchengensis]SDD82178.1 Signal transduction histidine kinase [Nocardioides lianchengensis]